ncbi:beta strand repeat-containing protein [Nocardioides stalactiti]|uniref:beta strand repeat-containing protein n=1 Tax=Nocardioides stalactiti TaxID=2755356 RepID=UPI00160119E7|nr:Ig-like domain-containing protein [Nocardioides stalactiti]
MTTDDFTYTLAPGGAAASVAVTVTCVDDESVAVDDTASVAEDSSATTIDVLGNDTDVESDVRSVASVTQPTNGTVVIANAGADLTYEPDADYCNDGVTTDDFTYTLGSGDTAEVKVTVTCVNDAPTADDESFTGASAAVGNTVLVVDDATDAAPSETGPHKTVSGDLLAGDTDPEGDSLSITAETVTSADGGSAVIEADGDFVFTPAPGCTDTTDTFDYELSDGTDTDTGTVTIDLSGCVWYVRNNATAGGGGVSNAPFDTLLEAQDASSSGDTIYVYQGDTTSNGYDTGITLKANQALLGELVDLVIGSDTLATGFVNARPRLTNTDADVITLDDNNTVRGVLVNPTGSGGGIAGGTGDVGGTITDVRIADLSSAGTQPGLELDGTSGLWTFADFLLENTTATGATSGSVGIRLNNAGTVTFADTGAITLNIKGAKALDLTGTSLLNSVFDAVRVTGSATGGVSATNAGGSVVVDELSIATTGGTGLSLINAPGWSIPNADDATGDTVVTVSSAAGPAVDLQSTSGFFWLDTLSSTNSATDGVNIDGMSTGTFLVGGGTISGASGIAFDVNAGSGDITYQGAIGNGTGASIEVTGRTGGTVSLTGQVSDSADNGGGINLANNTGGLTQLLGASSTIQAGTGKAVSMTNSDGHTLRLAGGDLTLSTTTGTALEASSSGTIVVTGSSNTASAAGGVTLRVLGTDIGADDLIFESLHAAGGGVQVHLWGTGDLGSLIVTGAGGTCTHLDTSGCSGGTLTDGAMGMELEDTLAPSLTRMWFHDQSFTAITAISPRGFSLAHSVLDGVLGTTADNQQGGVRVYNASGTVSVRDTSILGGTHNGLFVSQTGTGPVATTIDDVVFGIGTSSPSGGALGLSNSASGPWTAQVTDSSFDSGAMLMLDGGTGGADVEVTQNSFAGGFRLWDSATGSATSYEVSDNSVTGSAGHGAYILDTGAAAQTGTFANNTIDAQGPSAAIAGDGIRFTTSSVSTATTWAFTSNQVRDYQGNGIHVESNGTSSRDLTLTGNTIEGPATTASPPQYAVRMRWGTGAGGDSLTACVNLSNNVVHLGGDADGSSGSVVPGDTDLRISQEGATTVRLPGYTGGNTAIASVQSFLNANNSAGTTSLASVSGTGGGFVGGAGCATPPVP